MIKAISRLLRFDFCQKTGTDSSLFSVCSIIDFTISHNFKLEFNVAKWCSSLDDTFHEHIVRAIQCFLSLARNCSLYSENPFLRMYLFIQRNAFILWSRKKIIGSQNAASVSWLLGKESYVYVKMLISGWLK